jgi:hypothetical protein
MRFSWNHPMTLEMFTREANTIATTTDVCTDESLGFGMCFKNLPVLLFDALIYPPPDIFLLQLTVYELLTITQFLILS